MRAIIEAFRNYIQPECGDNKKFGAKLLISYWLFLLPIYHITFVMWLSRKDEHNLLFLTTKSKPKDIYTHFWSHDQSSRIWNSPPRTANSLQSAYLTPMRHVHTIDNLTWWLSTGDTLWLQIPNNLKFSTRTSSIYNLNKLNRKFEHYIKAFSIAPFNWNPSNAKDKIWLPISIYFFLQVSSA